MGDDELHMYKLLIVSIASMNIPSWPGQESLSMDSAHKVYKQGQICNWHNLVIDELNSFQSSARHVLVNFD